jgi:hypothetical protein
MKGLDPTCIGGTLRRDGAHPKVTTRPHLTSSVPITLTSLPLTFTSLPHTPTSLLSTHLPPHLCATPLNLYASPS